jgi:hypothetical protein
MKVILIALAFAATAMAQSVTLTMGEVPFQPINNLAVTKGGITFTFSDPGGTLFYNASNGGQMTYTQDPTIEGSAADAFGVTFSVPVPFVSFGIAANRVGATGYPIATVQYFNGATLVATQTVNATLSDIFGEGQLVYSGAEVTRILVTPFTNQGFTAIGFDNLGVSTTNSVPTLSSAGLGLMTVSLALLGSLALRRRSV